MNSIEIKTKRVFDFSVNDVEEMWNEDSQCEDEEFFDEVDLNIDDDFIYDEDDLTPTSFEKRFKTKKQIIGPIIPIIQEEVKQPGLNSHLKWARFTDESTDSNPMIVVGKILGPRQLSIPKQEIGTKKKRSYAFSQKKQPQLPLVKKSQFCFSITKGIECPHYNCLYVHHYSAMEECKFKDQCKFALKVDDGLYVKNPEGGKGKCTKRHLNECVESYILRLGIKINNCTSVILRVSPEIFGNSEVLRQVLENSKACQINQMIWQKRTVVVEKQGKDDTENEDEDDWFQNWFENWSETR